MHLHDLKWKQLALPMLICDVPTKCWPVLNITVDYCHWFWSMTGTQQCMLSCWIQTAAFLCMFPQFSISFEHFWNDSLSVLPRLVSFDNLCTILLDFSTVGSVSDSCISNFLICILVALSVVSTICMCCACVPCSTEKIWSSLKGQKTGWVWASVRVAFWWQLWSGGEWGLAYVSTNSNMSETVSASESMFREVIFCRALFSHPALAGVAKEGQISGRKESLGCRNPAMTCSAMCVVVLWLCDNLLLTLSSVNTLYALWLW